MLVSTLVADVMGTMTYVCEHNTDANEPDLPRNDPATPFLAAELRLVHGHRAGVDTSSKPSNNTADDQVSKAIRAGLQAGTDDDQSHGQPYRLTTPDDVAHEEVEDAPEESAQAVGADCDAGDGGSRVVELIEPVFVLEDAAEHALVVTEEQERTETASVDGRLKGPATAVEGCPDHVEWVMRGTSDDWTEVGVSRGRTLGIENETNDKPLGRLYGTL